jgi:hypothetical protein
VWVLAKLCVWVNDLFTACVVALCTAGQRPAGLRAPSVSGKAAPPAGGRCTLTRVPCFPSLLCMPDTLLLATTPFYAVVHADLMVLTMSWQGQQHRLCFSWAPCCSSVALLRPVMQHMVPLLGVPWQLLV